MVLLLVPSLAAPPIPATSRPAPCTDDGGTAYSVHTPSNHHAEPEDIMHRTTGTRCCCCTQPAATAAAATALRAADAFFSHSKSTEAGSRYRSVYRDTQWALPTCKLCSIQKAPWGLLRFCGCRRAARSWSAGNSNSEFARQIGRTGPTEIAVGYSNTPSKVPSASIPAVRCTLGIAGAEI